MTRAIFDADEIHEMRLEVAKLHATMTKEEARRERQKHAENTRRAIEEIRLQKKQAVGG